MLNKQSVLTSVGLHLLIVMIVGWSLSRPSPTSIQPAATPAVVATLWSAPPPILVPPPKPIKSEASVSPMPAPTPDVPQKTAEIIEAAVPEKPAPFTWGDTSPLMPVAAARPDQAPMPELPAPQGPLSSSAGVDNFDEVMRLAAERVEASGARLLVETALSSDTPYSRPSEPERSELAVPERPPVASPAVEPVTAAPDPTVLDSAFDPLVLYQQQVAALIQKSLRLTQEPIGAQCTIGLQMMNNGLIVESYPLTGHQGLCADAIKATGRLGALPVPPKEMGESRFHHLRVTILF